MERNTVEIYDQGGLEWAATHATAGRRVEAEAFADRVAPGELRLDVGSGAGRYLPHLGHPVVAFDASVAMLDACRKQFPGAVYVQGDVEHLPFSRGSIGGAWSWMTHLHIPRDRLPMALWDLHRVLTVGSPFEIQVLEGGYEGDDLPGDDVGGRFFAGWTPERLTEVVIGAGFEVEPGSVSMSGDEVRLRSVRSRTLADTVGPGMRLLVCGVNPSPFSADAGVGYARPGNRFWPAALAAGVVDTDRDPAAALVGHGMGMTDFLKRPTRTAAEVTAAEYRSGFERLEHLVEWLRPGAVCFTGLSGWRSVVDPKAVAGLQPTPIGGRPAYVMPSTSGLNARTSLGELAAHLRRAWEIGGGSG
ncbi:MAG TPA: methyltransferase domain-containing protein [Acidimicrobiales bacterium]|jgi:TDG/mug DNA glycosylase family protein|nr:methyltransferase domain-containing protein [Acidimicrobiales bacterium]